MNTKNKTIFCSCGCGCGVLLQVDKEYPSCVGIKLVSDASLEMRKPREISIKEKLKRIWYVIRNKEYTYFDIWIKDEEELQEFKEFVEKI